MTISQSVRNNLCKGFRTLGVDRSTTLQLVDQLGKWDDSWGTEKLVNHLKDVKVGYLHYLDTGSWKQGAMWIKLRSDGLPSGPIGKVCRDFKNQEHKLLSILNCYCNFVAARPTDAQKAKFFDSATATPTSATVNPVRLWLVRPDVDTWYYTKDVRQQEDLAIDIVKSAYSRVPAAFADVPKPEDLERLIRYHRDFSRDAMSPGSAWSKVSEMMPQNNTNQLLTLTPCKREYVESADGSFVRSTPVVERSLKTYQVGSLGFSQEPGYKLRVFAAPRIELQAILEPLKRFLFEQLKKLPEDCCFDQNRGKEDVLAWLKEGKTCHSIDLSDATNNFPYHVQQQLLRELKVPLYYQKAMDVVAKGSYAVPEQLRQNPSQKEIQFTKGQPLGAGPSFALFSLAHHALVREAALRQGLRPFQEYRILGDDIVIAHDGVAAEYKQLLRELSIPVSEKKCISSKSTAEFAGAVIRPNGLVQPWKWKTPSDQSFMDVARGLHSLSRAKRMFSPKQWNQLKKLESALSPVGLGFNPKGLTYSARFAATETWKQSRMRKEPNERRMVEILHKYIYGVSGSTPADQRVADLLVARRDAVDKTVVTRASSHANVIRPAGDPRPSQLLTGSALDHYRDLESEFSTPKH